MQLTNWTTLSTLIVVLRTACAYDDKMPEYGSVPTEDGKSDNTVDVRLRRLEATVLPCFNKKLIHSGNIISGIADAPLGTVCIGNGQNQTPNQNFLVFYKKSPTACYFRGTQSNFNGFTDFQPYVNWVINPTSDAVRKDLGQCAMLPHHLLGGLKSPGPYCSLGNSTGLVYLIHPESQGAIVDNYGAIHSAATSTATLWI